MLSVSNVLLIGFESITTVNPARHVESFRMTQESNKRDSDATIHNQRNSRSDAATPSYGNKHLTREKTRAPSAP